MIMNTTENNKLIADFMGYEIDEYGFFADGLGRGRFKSIADNKGNTFDTSWDWLMPVVEKCFYKYDFTYNEGQNRFQGWYEVNHKLQYYQTIITIGKSIMEAYYKAVVEFIKWYNENN